jgi:hypothetical protein
MYTLLDSTGEYEQVLRIDGNQSSSKVKQQLVNFLTQFKGKAVDQVLFYFTGHGDFDGSEFNYVLSDFDISKKKQTVIENTELDNWLRIINPALTVKVVDACHAGVQYIKDPNVFQISLSKTAQSFQSCYFFFSSQKDQYSYQNASLSEFTHSFVKAVASFQGTEIRFKDMIDYISDEFTSNPNQTPYFVTQATNTERFSPISQQLRSSLESELAKHLLASLGGANKTDLIEPPPSSLIDRVKTDALRFCSKEEVLSFIIGIQRYWQEKTYNSDVSSLYEFQCQLLSSMEGEVPLLSSIGKWLSENENNYFAHPTSRQEEYQTLEEVPIKKKGHAAAWASIAAISSSLYGQEYETKTVTRTRQVITGFRLTQDVEHPAIRIMAVPRFENLSWHDCHISYVFSKTQIRLFYLFSTFRETNWEQRARQPDETWRMIAADFKSPDGVESALDKITIAFVDHVMTPVRIRFGSDSPDSIENQEASQPAKI